MILLIIMAISLEPARAESSAIQLTSEIIQGAHPNPYGLTGGEALMILTAEDQTSFDNYNSFSEFGKKTFLNQCLQNSWLETAGSTRVYVRLDYQDRVYDYIITTFLADPEELELVSFATGIDDLQFMVIINRDTAIPPESIETKPAQDRWFENIDYQKGSAIRVIIDGKQVEFDVAPQIVDGRTLVPMRAIFEQFGLQVAWKESTGTAMGYNNQHAVSFIIGENQALVNGQIQALDVPASIIEGRTMIPLRFLSASLGYNVVWAGEAELILISRDNIMEWRLAGYENQPPYKEYEALHINGAEYNEVRYTGRTRPAVSITAQGIVQQMRGTFYRVDFSDGFGVAITLPKHKVAYVKYEAVKLGVDSSETNQVPDISKMVITGFGPGDKQEFRPLNYTEYAAQMPAVIQEVYQEQDFFLAAGSMEEREINGLVVFDSKGTLAGISFQDGIHNCKLYLEE